MKVFVTNKALTRKGIQTAEGEVESKGYFLTDDHLCYYDGEWHRTWEEAVREAERMKQEKIRRLKKKIARLEHMTWSRP
jgi:hypothetical protein